MSINLPGLSGYDFSGIIASMVQVYKLPENRLNDRKSSLQIQKDAWRDVNSRLLALDNTLATLKSSSTWTATTLSSSDPTAVSGTAGSSATAGIYTVKVTNTAKAEVVVSAEFTDTSLATQLGSYTDSGISSNWDFQITVGGVTKSIYVKNSTANPTPGLADIRDAINNAGAGVTASLTQTSSGNYRLEVISNKTGSTGGTDPITFTDPNGVLNKLGLVDATGTVYDRTAGLTDPTLGGKIQSAMNASFTVNGLQYSSAVNTITDAIQGVTLNLLKDSSQSTITLAADPSVAQKAVQAFVDQYNSVNSFIADKLSYDPNTKKAGDLFGDPMLQGIQSRLRTLMGSEFYGTMPKFLSDVGVEIADKDGTLSFDTTKFNDMLASNPQGVANLFSAPYGGVTPKNDYTNKVYEGVANILHAYIDPLASFTGRINDVQNNLGEQIKDVNDQIQSFEERAADYEERLKVKFANLEALLSNLNAQSSWLMSQTNLLTAANTKK